MRVLVFGGTGFIGSHVVTMLARAGHDVTILHRGETEGDLPPSVRHLHGRFDRLPELLGDLGDWSPEVVLDMVPYLDKQGHGVLHLKDIAQRAVVITSCDVYRAFGRLWRSEPGPPDPLPLTEDSPLRLLPAADGGGEEAAFDNVDVERALSCNTELPVTILRLPATHGPGDPQHRLSRYLQRMEDGRPMILLEESHARWRWVRGYVENVAAAIALAVQDNRATGRVYNVAEQSAYTEADWVRRIGQVVGWSGRVVTVPRNVLPEPLRQPFDFTQDCVVDSSRIRTELGYCEPVGEAIALKQTIAWERRNPPSTTSSAEYQLEDDVLEGRS
jgi:nucleoside-diphosphate-sugar epimerase